MYNIFFISYNEPTAEENYAKLQARFPFVKRIKGVKGIQQAHVQAAKLSFTPMFWVVDADAQVLDSFDFTYEVPKHELEVVHVWRSRNPINDLEYGYGGVKLLPKKLTMEMDTSKVDMTTSISERFKAMEEVSNITAFNTDAFSAWRSAFRECCKLSSKVIDRQDDAETIQRLITWCTVGDERPWGLYAIAGALAGKAYGEKNASDMEALSKINDFTWLEDQYLQSQQP